MQNRSRSILPASNCPQVSFISLDVVLKVTSSSESFVEGDVSTSILSRAVIHDISKLELWHPSKLSSAPVLALFASRNCRNLEINVCTFNVGEQSLYTLASMLSCIADNHDGQAHSRYTYTYIRIFQRPTLLPSYTHPSAHPVAMRSIAIICFCTFAFARGSVHSFVSYALSYKSGVPCSFTHLPAHCFALFCCQREWLL